MTLNGQNAYAVTGKQELIYNGRNVRLVLVLLTYIRVGMDNSVVKVTYRLIEMHRKHSHTHEVRFGSSAQVDNGVLGFRKPSGKLTYF